MDIQQDSRAKQQRKASYGIQCGAGSAGVGKFVIGTVDETGWLDGSCFDGTGDNIALAAIGGDLIAVA